MGESGERCEGVWRGEGRSTREGSREMRRVGGACDEGEGEGEGVRERTSMLARAYCVKCGE